MHDKINNTWLTKLTHLIDPNAKKDVFDQMLNMNEVESFMNNNLYLLLLLLLLLHEVTLCKIIELRFFRLYYDRGLFQLNFKKVSFKLGVSY